ncbi:HipA domain-containing protein [Candidatus Poriferisodalis sp.]|uniref:HipA domain-containing protein n=1 Tax=Candidatus Poriferisodalis sp. TaxID=3101277 RepID=UPI003B5C6AA2
MPASASHLHVFLHGTLVGVAVRLRRGAVHLAWDHSSGFAPEDLSQSFHGNARGNLDITDWIDGLLPDNPRTRSRWAQDLQAASAAPFDLLCTRAGLECAGAVQFHPQPALPDAQQGTLVHLTEDEVAHLLRTVIPDSGDDADPLGAPGLGELRLSLGGAQAKMALRRDGAGWHLPTGSLATTHILKPQSGHRNPGCRESIAVNEHVCQTAVSAVGVATASTTLEMFDGEPCIVVDRYDRSSVGAVGDEVGRLHSEDLCQALGFASEFKYQRDGGPTPEAILRFLRQASDKDDAHEFFLGIYANWLIGNTDGHSKNYSVLLHEGVARLAPLYDLSSALPYLAPGTPPRPAMRFADGSPDSLAAWSVAAERLRTGVVYDELESIAKRLPDALEAAADACPSWAQLTARDISEQVAARARRVFSESRRSGPAVAPVTEPETRPSSAGGSGVCGVVVGSTGDPCLLYRGHHGRHRSKLPGRKS